MNFDEMEKKADDLIDRNRLRAAERILLKMLAADPKSIGAHFNLVRVYNRTNQFDRAVIHGRRTLRLSPKEQNASVNLGISYDLMGKPDRALVYYKRELKREPGNPLAHWWMGRLYFEKRQWRKAMRHLEKCNGIGGEEGDAETVYKLCRCYNELNDILSYLRAYKEYLHRVPNAAWAASSLAGGLMHAKEFKRAIFWYQKAESIKPSESNREHLRLAHAALLKSKAA
jgi:tetratricopeptide (TPR) repeat protein